MQPEAVALLVAGGFLILHGLAIFHAVQIMSRLPPHELQKAFLGQMGVSEQAKAYYKDAAVTAMYHNFSYHCAIFDMVLGLFCISSRSFVS